MSEPENYVFRKITTIGGSYAVVIPQAYYEALGNPPYAKVSLVKDGDELYVRIDPA